jgi:excisionase family DNA binding protein
MEQEKPFEFLTPRELAQYMNVSMTGVYRLVEGRHIDVYRFGKRLRFRKADVDKYIESQRYPAIDQRRPRV